MKTKVSQSDLIVNIRYAKSCDYIYAYNVCDRADGKIHTLLFPNIINDIVNDNRNCISIYSKLGHHLRLFNSIKNINKKFIIITGCSDESITEKMYMEKPHNVIMWYAENVEYKNDLLISLPLGSISGTWIGNNINECEWTSHSKFQLINITNKEPQIINLVFMCFSLETNKNHRTQVYNYFDNKSWVTNLCKQKTGAYLNDDLFMNNVYNHHFVIAPFGNGIDCGRTWSILQLGSIPIIPYHSSFEDWADNLPILLYHDINEITEEYLKTKLVEFKNKDYNYDYLKTSYWSNRFEKDKLSFNQ